MLPMPIFLCTLPSQWNPVPLLRTSSNQSDRCSQNSQWTLLHQPWFFKIQFFFFIFIFFFNYNHFFYSQIFSLTRLSYDLEMRVKSCCTFHQDKQVDRWTDLLPISWYNGQFLIFIIKCFVLNSWIRNKKVIKYW